MRRVRTAAPAFYAALLVSLLLPLSADAAGEIGAIGQLAPKGGIIDLAGASGTQIQSILVKPHDTVRRGDVLVILSNHDVLKAESEIARLERDSAEQGGKDRLALQRAVRAAAELRLSHADAAVAEYRALGANALSQAELTQRRNLATEARSLVAIESLRLRQLEKEIGFESARAALRLALSEARLRNSTIVAPSDGTILEIRRQLGETLGGDPVIRMADLSEIYVVADVFEGDVLKLKEGMPASASSKSLPKPLEGVVHRVDRIVDTARKLAKVVIRLGEAEAAERLIGMEVQVTIRTEGSQ